MADLGGMGPTAVAVDRTLTPEILYIADEQNGRILKFNASTGARLAVLGSTGFGDGQFNRPYGIAIEPATRDLYVAERGNGRVQRITNTGAYVMKWGEYSATPNSAQGFFNEPIGVAAAADGHVYVVDKANNRVQKFRVTSSGGTWQVQNVAMFGTTGAALGQLDRPYGIALESTGNAFWVADAGNHRIQRFSSAGVPLRAVGTLGSGGGQFILPTAIALDGAGNLYVTETNTDPQNTALADINQQRVQRFTPAGDYDNFFWGGTYGTAPGQFRLPFGIAIGPLGYAFVADYYNLRVQIFDLGTPPPQAGPVITSAPQAAGTVGEAFAYQITADKPVTSYAASGLPPGLAVNTGTGAISGTPTTVGRTVATISVVSSQGSASASLTVDIAAAPPSAGPWQSQDIGAVAAAGSGSESGGVVTLTGSGADIWDRADEFRFRHQTLNADGEIVARVASLQNTNGWAKAGVMIRETLATGSRHVFMCLSATNGSSLQQRAIAGGNSTAVSGPWVGAPHWVKLVRSGSTITGYTSANGTTWAQVGTVTMSFSSSVQVGLAVTSHNDGTLCTATLDNVVVSTSGTTNPPPTPPAAPSALTASATSATQIALTWTDNSTTESGFEIERSSDNVTFAPTGSVSADVVSFTATGLTADTWYYFRVRAVASAGNSTYSNVASGRTPAAATLGAPSGLAATSVSTTQIRLNWIDNATSETGFAWALSTDSVNFTWNSGVAANATTITVGSLTPGTAYSFRVRAVQGTTMSASSNTATATTTANPPPATAPAAPSGLTATTSSDTAVALSWVDNSTNEEDFQVEVSSDNVTFSLIARTSPNATTYAARGLTAATRYYFRVRAGNSGGLSAYANTASVTTTGTPPQPTGTLTRTDIGAVAATGSLSQSGTTYSVSGSGEDIWGSSDEFSFAYTGWNADGTFIARLTSQQNTDPWAKAGIMLRESLTPGSRYVMITLTPRGDTGMQARTAVNGSTTFTSAVQQFMPSWLRLVRSGTTIHASHSGDGVSWVPIGSVTIDLPAALFAGLAVSSHRDGTLGTATFDNVSINAGSTPPPVSPPTAPSGLVASVNSNGHVSLNWTDNSGNETSFQLERSTDNATFALVATRESNVNYFTDTAVSPATTYSYRVRAMNGTAASAYSTVASVTTPTSSTPGPTWQHVDVGAVGIPGSDDAVGNTITVRGSGADIWENVDAFRFLYQVRRGDCEIEAKVVAMSATHAWAKAGVMVRESLAANARNVFMAVTPSSGVHAQVRATTGGATSATSGPWGAGVPYWVRIKRTGDTLAASISVDGTTWTTLSMVTLPMAADVYVGFAVTAHNNAALNTSTFGDPLIR